ncbi:MAG: hypothetical protein U0793_21690 [Gemmataceae bacterium]
MVNRNWLALLVGAGVLASASGARAGDTVLLGGAPAANTATLALNAGDAATELVAYRGGGGHGGGHYGGGHYGHVGHYGGYGHYGHGFYGGRYGFGYGYGYRSYYRPYYASYYRPYYYSSYYYPSYYYPYSYYPSYYVDPGYYYGGYYTPCSTTVVATAPTVTLRAGVAPATYAPPSYGTPTYGTPTYGTPTYGTRPGPLMPPADSPDGTYRYDGGPMAPMPLPSDTPPTVDPARPTLPRDGRFVSLPATKAPIAYPAYGERTPAPRATEPGTILVSTPAPAATTSRLTYPAYGESRK